jgi:acyl-coenzyme A synthetase/AMP-(fatty) acid ligase
VRLLDALSAVDPKRIAVRTPRRELTYETLCASADELAPHLVGARIALATSDVMEAVVLLAAADSSASEILLMSPTLDEVTLASYLETSGPDFTLTDIASTAGSADQFRRSDSAQRASGAIVARAKLAAPRLATDWILTTSGTTGRPKSVSHSLEGLTRTTKQDVAIGLGQVWGLIYDFSRFAGLQVLLQSLMSGACLAAADLASPLSKQIGFLTGVGCSHLSATPTLWRKILMSPGSSDLQLKQVTLGGEIVDASIIASLARAFPSARLTHIFASTEAGVGFSVSDRQPGFPASFLTDPPAGIGLRIIDGRLQVHNPLRAGRDRGEDVKVSGEDWVDTGDAVEVRGARVYFRGREDGVINVGGNKVHPEEVERALLSHPKVAMARVYAKSNPITGQLVAADVVPAPNAGDDLRADLTAYLGERLSRYAIPALLRLSPRLEINAAGKVVRNA